MKRLKLAMEYRLLEDRPVEEFEGTKSVQSFRATSAAKIKAQQLREKKLEMDATYDDDLDEEEEEIEEEEGEEDVQKCSSCSKILPEADVNEDDVKKKELPKQREAVYVDEATGLPIEIPPMMRRPRCRAPSCSVQQCCECIRNCRDIPLLDLERLEASDRHMIGKGHNDIAKVLFSYYGSMLNVLASESVARTHSVAAEERACFEALEDDRQRERDEIKEKEKEKKRSEQQRPRTKSLKGRKTSVITRNRSAESGGRPHNEAVEKKIQEAAAAAMQEAHGIEQEGVREQEDNDRRYLEHEQLTSWRLLSMRGFSEGAWIANQEQRHAAARQAYAALQAQSKATAAFAANLMEVTLLEHEVVTHPTARAALEGLLELKIRELCGRLTIDESAERLRLYCQQEDVLTAMLRVERCERLTMCEMVSQSEKERESRELQAPQRGQEAERGGPVSPTSAAECMCAADTFPLQCLHTEILVTKENSKLDASNEQGTEAETRDGQQLKRETSLRDSRFVPYTVVPDQESQDHQPETSYTNNKDHDTCWTRCFLRSNSFRVPEKGAGEGSSSAQSKLPPTQIVDVTSIQPGRVAGSSPTASNGPTAQQQQFNSLLLPSHFVVAVRPHQALLRSQHHLSSLIVQQSYEKEKNDGDVDGSYTALHRQESSSPPSTPYTLIVYLSSVNDDFLAIHDEKEKRDDDAHSKQEDEQPLQPKENATYSIRLRTASYEEFVILYKHFLQLQRAPHVRRLCRQERESRCRLTLREEPSSRATITDGYRTGIECSVAMTPSEEHTLRSVIEAEEVAAFQHLARQRYHESISDAVLVKVQSDDTSLLYQTHSPADNHPFFALHRSATEIQEREFLQRERQERYRMEQAFQQEFLWGDRTEAEGVDEMTIAATERREREALLRKNVHNIPAWVWVPVPDESSALKSGRRPSSGRRLSARSGGGGGTGTRAGDHGGHRRQTAIIFNTETEPSRTPFDAKRIQYLKSLSQSTFARERAQGHWVPCALSALVSADVETSSKAVAEKDDQSQHPSYAIIEPRQRNPLTRKSNPELPNRFSSLVVPGWNISSVTTERQMEDFSSPHITIDPTGSGRGQTTNSKGEEGNLFHARRRRRSNSRAGSAASSPIRSGSGRFTRTSVSFTPSTSKTSTSTSTNLTASSLGSSSASVINTAVPEEYHVITIGLRAVADDFSDIHHGPAADDVGTKSSTQSANASKSRTSFVASAPLAMEEEELSPSSPSPFSSPSSSPPPPFAVKLRVNGDVERDLVVECLRDKVMRRVSQGDAENNEQVSRSKSGAFVGGEASAADEHVYKRKEAMCKQKRAGTEVPPINIAPAVNEQQEDGGERDKRRQSTRNWVKVGAFRHFMVKTSYRAWKPPPPGTPSTGRDCTVQKDDEGKPAQKEEEGEGGNGEEELPHPQPQMADVEEKLAVVDAEAADPPVDVHHERNTPIYVLGDQPQSAAPSSDPSSVSSSAPTSVSSSARRNHEANTAGEEEKVMVKIVDQSLPTSMTSIVDPPQEQEADKKIDENDKDNNQQQQRLLSTSNFNQSNNNNSQHRLGIPALTLSDSTAMVALSTSAPFAADGPPPENEAKETESQKNSMSITQPHTSADRTTAFLRPTSASSGKRSNPPHHSLSQSHDRSQEQRQEQRKRVEALPVQKHKVKTAFYDISDTSFPPTPDSMRTPADSVRGGGLTSPADETASSTEQNNKVLHRSPMVSPRRSARDTVESMDVARYADISDGSMPMSAIEAALNAPGLSTQTDFMLRNFNGSNSSADERAHLSSSNANPFLQYQGSAPFSNTYNPSNSNLSSTYGSMSKGSVNQLSMTATLSKRPSFARLSPLNSPKSPKSPKDNNNDGQQLSAIEQYRRMSARGSDLPKRRASFKFQRSDSSLSYDGGGGGDTFDARRKRPSVAGFPGLNSPGSRRSSLYSPRPYGS